MSNVTFAVVIWVLTVVVWILVKAIGFPHQFKLNYKRKSTKGVSVIFYLLAFLSYILWTVHWFLQDDRVLILGQWIGVITTGMIVVQIILYRKNK